MVTIDGYKIDVAVSEGHNFTAQVTAHPVEKGADVADHVRLQPIKVTVSGIVTDTPIGVIGDERGKLGTQIAADVGALPSMDAYDHLYRVWQARQPVTIETSLQVFENMVLDSLSAPRAAGDGESLRFDASFTQIGIVANERTFVDVPPPQPTERGQPFASKRLPPATLRVPAPREPSK